MIKEELFGSGKYRFLTLFIFVILVIASYKYQVFSKHSTPVKVTHFLRETTITTPPREFGVRSKEPVRNPVRTCTQRERLDLLENKCSRNIRSFEELSKQDQRTVANHIYVDEKHKILACLPPKAGCTTWKAILANNSSENPLPAKFSQFRHVMGLHQPNVLHRFGVLNLATLNVSQQTEILQSDEYFKFMVTRNPFERLHSGFINKFVSDLDPAMRRRHGSLILDLFHPELEESIRREGKGVTFAEFIRYVKHDRYSRNEHWEPAFNLCQPCVVRYDQIVKTETMDEDNAEIITKHLGPYSRGIRSAYNIGIDSRTTRHNGTSLSRIGRKLEAYSALSLTDIKFILFKYRKDFEYFGYAWKFIRNETNRPVLYSSCTQGSIHSSCC